MDGTLLDNAGNLPPNFYEQYRELKNRNINFVIASGRQISTLYAIFKPIKEELIYISQNGAYVEVKGEELYSNSLNFDDVLAIIKRAKQIPDTFILLCGIEKAYINSVDSVYIDILNQFVTDYEIIEDFEQLKNIPILKISLCDIKDPVNNSLPYFIDLKDSFHITVSGKYWFDITHKQSNKGYAVKLLQEFLKINFDQTMIFGDYDNDIEMLQNGYFSYAMKNSGSVVKNAANFLAPSNDQYGVMVVVKELINAIF